MSTPTDTENLLPRRYQEEVFVQAQEGNIIAALHTGAGKTLISLLLIRWIAAQESSKTKAIIFLVPKVTLVEQQGNFIAQHTPLRVIKLHGALDIDLSDRLGWKRRFASNDVFVMTAQIFLNLLTHAHWSIDRVSLMIFDECHHARKNHPYNGILREYFQVQSTVRPKIFGMTASPIWNPKDAIGSLASLEANMDAKVISVRENVEELKKHSPKPVELIKEYPPPSNENSNLSPSVLYSCLNLFERSLWTTLDIPWLQLEMRYFVTLNNLGSYAASLFLYTEFKQHMTRVVNTRKPPIHDIFIDYGDIDMDVPSNPLPSEGSEIHQILSDFEPFFVSPSPDSNSLSVGLEWCTPKVKVLVDVLLAYSSSTFQGIIFVEQRQVAACLARILPCIPQLVGLVRCAYLVGQGVNSEGVSNSMGASNQQDAVKMFRDGEINLLIATSVAEEGLDFPACDLVVRFDPLQHLVGYVQSRGRARNKASTFIIMIQKDDVVHLTRYKALQEGEPELDRAYQSRHADGNDDDNDESDDETDPADLPERERFVVASTGAFATYDNAISLLNDLCALIPRDAFTPVHVPKFAGDFEATLRLPSAIPLPPADLVFTGPVKRSKKEAKRAVSFLAVKRLYELDVFDQYLYPDSRAPAEGDAEENRQAMINARQVPIMMDVSVKNPWFMGPKLWIHPVHVNGRRMLGLVTGTKLPSTELRHKSDTVQVGTGIRLLFDVNEENRRRSDMHEYTRLGIWYRITSRPITSPLSLFFVPINVHNQPDYEAIERLIKNPYGSFDWSNIDEEAYDRLLVMNRNQFARILLLRKIRHDLTPQSLPPQGSREAGFSSYHDYFVDRWTRKKGVPHVPTDGPLIDTLTLPRFHDGSYPLKPGDHDFDALSTVSDGMLIPRDCCSWIDIPLDIYETFSILPALCHRLTDVYRIRQARFELGLPPIVDDLLVEAYTLPCATAGYNNQRMETLGDTVLKLCTTVHLLNKFPTRHEGQLDRLRKDTITNMYLLSRAKDLGLEQYLTSEIPSVHIWRYVVPEETTDDYGEAHMGRSVARRFGRRGLQDCMEATLGASFLTGGIPMALRAGTALGLAFGGTLPWPMRYTQDSAPSSVSALFSGLQESLGYTFRSSHLIIEAVTHPSFASSSGSSYQRLEFLGDALLDLVVVKYLYDKFPQATSHMLAWPKTRAVCNSALASLAVRRLRLHNIMLINSVDLNLAINKYVPILEATSGEEIAHRGWRFDPPKALGDVFESVMGAVLVDSGYNYDRAAAVAEYVMDDILVALSPSLAQDPASELTEWAAGLGCSKVKIKKMQKLRGDTEVDGMAVLVHGDIVVGPIIAASLSVAKFAASERALAILKDPTSKKSLSRLCTCGKTVVSDAVDSNSGAASPTVDSSVFAEQDAMNMDPLTGDISDAADMDEVMVILTEENRSIAGGQHSEEQFTKD